MADILLNPGYSGNAQVLQKFSEIAGLTSFAFNFGAATAVSATLATAAPSGGSFSVDADEMHLKTDMANAYTLSGVQFQQGGIDLVVKGNGDVHKNLNPTTGLGTVVGEMSGGAGQIVLTNWPAGTSPLVSNFRGAAAAPVEGPFTPFGGYEVMFRTAAAPLRSGSLSVQGTLLDGTTFNATADTSGNISTTRVKGKVNFNTGVVDLFAVRTSPVGSAEQVDLSFLEIPGVSLVYLDMFRIESLRYNAVAFAYLPLDADILGIDPVRLPSDGRVPIFRPGTLAVVSNTVTTFPATLSNGNSIDFGRERLSRVRLIGEDGATINTGYTVDLEAGTAEVVSIAGWDQPVRWQHTIEDMVQVRDAQINGEVSFIPQLSHDYPAGSFISSALVGGDLVSRVSLIFDQASWDQITFSDVQSGSAAPGTYNDTAYPIELTNAGAETERWAIRFTSPTAFLVIGEHVGVIDTGNTGTDCSPTNPVTGEPYFTLSQSGWGAGWSVGNILRFNTVGARFSYWAIRTIKQGPETGEDYSFALLTRGGIDNPIA